MTIPGKMLKSKTFQAIKIKKDNNFESNLKSFLLEIFNCFPSLKVLFETSLGNDPDWHIFIARRKTNFYLI